MFELDNEFHRMNSGESNKGNLLFLKDDFSLDEHEKDLILKALEKSNYNKTKAAKILGISRATLRYRLVKYGISEQ